MKRFVSILALCLAVVLLASSLTGCQKSREEMLVGRWTDKYDPSGSFFVFAADGSGYYDLDDSGGLFWKLEGKTLTLQLPDGVVEVTIIKLTEKELILGFSRDDVLELVKG